MVSSWNLVILYFIILSVSVSECSPIYSFHCSLLIIRFFYKLCSPSLAETCHLFYAMGFYAGDFFSPAKFCETINVRVSLYSDYYQRSQPRTEAMYLMSNVMRLNKIIIF